MRAVIKRILSPFLKKASAVYLAQPRKYAYKNLSVVVAPSVFPPFITISTKLLLEFIETLPLQNKTLLELGCGCGIISVLAAQKGANVTATDINDVALTALEKNATDNQVSIDIIKSDLFEKLHEKTFDYIIINPPYYPKRPNSVAENAWFCGENFEYFEALFAQLVDFLIAENKTYMILSEDCELETIKKIGLKNQIHFNLVLEKKVALESNYIFELKL
ncbi:methyltransferase [Flavobacterium sp. CYK-4]|uniref:methyltransferase n=1 Tax=Flavobacterium lotistagni TaxID=2709660 RepID=UPI00140B528A|nr:methyltransferase [Flavobacterium lotistagni]NHM05886.1 methyltransferase [Flavobacterium lotistagni]